MMAATLAQQQTDVDCPLQEQLLLKLLVITLFGDILITFLSNISSP